MMTELNSMFNKMSIILFNNILFISGKISFMNNQMKRLYEAAKLLKGITGQSNIARAFNASPQTIKNWEDRGISNRGMISAQQIFGCSANWLENGVGQMSAKEPTALRVSEIPANNYANAVSIEKLQSSVSMSVDAKTQDAEAIADTLSISKKWIHLNLPTIRADNLRFIHGYGESMSPTFSDGDVLLVDTSINSFDMDGVYALAAQDQLYIKRVNRKLNGQHEMTSDNPSVKTVEIFNSNHEIEVLGRVVWAWNGKKL